MKLILTTLLSFFIVGICFSQTSSSDADIIKNFKTTILKDCQVWHKSQYAIKCEDTSRLAYSYEFDSNGNISKKIKYKSWEDTTLTIFTYDENHNVLSEILYGAKYSGTILTEFSYNKNGKMTKRLNYSFDNNIKQEDRSKVEYYYTAFDSLSKLIIYDYYPRKGYDTSYIEEYEYNSNKLLESLTIRDIEGHYYSPIGEGITKYRYDYFNKLEAVSHIARRGKNNEIDNHTNNYDLYYTYGWDSLISETCMQRNYYSKDVTIRNSQDRLSKKYSSTIRFSNPLYLKNGTNIPDIERNADEIESRGLDFKYDNLGRITEIKYEWENKHKTSGWGTNFTTFDVFIYNSEKSFILPENEYSK